MATLTEIQRKDYISSLKDYKKNYLKEEYFSLDESATRIMINNFLTNVLGYTELAEIRTEYSIKGTYADYVIQLDNVQHIIVEVKAIQINLNDNHIRQSIGYAANEGIDWVLLTNGKEWKLYRVIFGKPIESKLVFSYDFTNEDEFKKAIEEFEYLSKKCVSSGELEKFWNRHNAVAPKNLCMHLYKPDIIKCLKKHLKKDFGVNFNEEEIFDAVHEIIIRKIETNKPKFKQ